MVAQFECPPTVEASSVKKLQQQVARLTRENRKLRRLALIDPLTRIANRRYFDAQLDREFREASRQNRCLSLLMLDVDHFKLYNDTYGHPVGDKMLKQVASAVTSTVLRPGDLVARYGGEEFALILPDCTLEGGLTVAGRIANAVQLLGVTVSIGLTTSRQFNSPDKMLLATDQQLYRAKRQGRNQIAWTED